MSSTSAAIWIGGVLLGYLIGRIERAEERHTRRADLSIAIARSKKQ